jgi:hypothetical protein
MEESTNTCKICGKTKKWNVLPGYERITNYSCTSHIEKSYDYYDIDTEDGEMSVLIIE